MRLGSSILVAVASLTLAAPAARAQSADEIIAKYLKARGVDKWAAIQTMKVTATIDAQGRSTPMTVISKRPDLVRQEVTVNGTAIVEAYDGKIVWGLNPQVSPDPQPITGPQASALAQQADFDLVLHDYKNKGFEVELAGKITLGDRDAYDLKVTRPNGVVQHYFIDTATFLEDRVATAVTRGRETLNSTSDPSDFRDVDGVMMPFTITQQVSGMPAVVLRMRSIDFNVPVDDAIFTMPKKPQGRGSRP